jgi:hypothetical protein
MTWTQVWHYRNLGVRYRQTTPPACDLSRHKAMTQLVNSGDTYRTSARYGHAPFSHGVCDVASRWHVRCYEDLMLGMAHCSLHCLWTKEAPHGAIESLVQFSKPMSTRPISTDNGFHCSEHLRTTNPPRHRSFSERPIMR